MSNLHRVVVVECTIDITVLGLAFDEVLEVGGSSRGSSGADNVSFDFLFLKQLEG
jgi:hypothetical protein